VSWAGVAWDTTAQDFLTPPSPRSAAPRRTSPLQAHVALNAGITRAEIVAVIEQTATVAGFPRAQSALNTVRDVFAPRAAVQD